MGEASKGRKRFCSQCGAEVSPEDAFCWRCGTRLAKPVSEETQASGQVAPVAARAHEGDDPRGEAIEGESAQVTEDSGKADMDATSVFRHPHRPSDGPVASQTEDDSLLPPEAFDEAVGALGGEENPRAVLMRMRTGDSFRFEVPCIVGRGSGVGCRVEGNDAISREHAEVWRDEGGYLMRNLSATNPTFVDGSRVASGKSARLKDGSTVRLANEDFVFRIEG